jgi:hypothetical protein
LLKYLNESYINIVKITPQFRLFRLNEKFKGTVMYINSKWDDLHNEIAIKIKNVSFKIYYYFLKLSYNLCDVFLYHFEDSK